MLVRFGAIRFLKSRFSGTTGSMLLAPPLPRQRPWSRCLALHMGCDLWPSRDLSIIMTSVIQRQAVQFPCFSRELGKCLASQSCEHSLDIKSSTQVGLAGKLSSMGGGSSKSGLTWGSSPLAVTPGSSSSGAAALIPETRIRSAHGRGTGGSGWSSDELGLEWLGTDYSADCLVFNQG